MSLLPEVFLITLLAAGTEVPVEDAGDEPVLIGGQVYRKMETREETLQRMTDLLTPEKGSWQEWHLLSPFLYRGFGYEDLYVPRAPEEELGKMGVNGEGPDLSKTYEGKNGFEARWTPLASIPNRRVDLKIHDDQDLNVYALCYLYTTVESDEARTVEIPMGSDDGVLVWLNGKRIHDVDAPRGMDPTSDLLVMNLEKGTNHVLFKIDQGEGGWDFQITTRDLLSSRIDAELYYRLDRDYPPSREREHYRVMTFPAPDDVVLEVGGLAFYGDEATPVVSTRRGDVFLVENAYAEPPLDAKFSPFATGLHEALGAGVRTDSDGESIYITQRGELTRLLDEDGDDVADLYQTFCDDWGVSGNYHEFAFGPKFDREGNAWVTLNVGFCGSLGKAVVPGRGSAFRIDREGNATWICDGLRSPNGMAEFTDGTMFYVENQGDYIATNRLSALKQNSWHGHPASLRWRNDLDSPDDRPPLQPPAIWFPYEKMGQSVADVVLDDTGGTFGPFAGQLFVGDQLAATIMRVSLEEIDGHHQGACFPFLKDLGCGVNRLAFAPDGSLFVGETDRGWTSIGRKRHGLERVIYTGEIPFEILSMRALPAGFELEFTKDIEGTSASDPSSYRMSSYTYEYHSDYGAPEDDTKNLDILSTRVVGPRTIQLEVSPLRKAYVHELHASGVRSVDGESLLHDDAYYTLIKIPGKDTDANKVLPRVLLVTESAGFVHSVVKRPRPHIYSEVEERIVEACQGEFDVTMTQDSSSINRDLLDDYRVVVFYTTGELPMEDENVKDLLNWIRGGGGFVGIHPATDTFYDEPPYQEMIGGVFDGHPWHQQVTVRVENSNHPSTEHLPDSFPVVDEIYQFKNFSRDQVDVLLSLDPSSVDISLGKREDGDYALSWCKNYGKGRVFYTALGHRLDVWKYPLFLDHVMGGIEWASGEE